MPPKARVCYICGRQYMVHSFPIHVAQCQELFEKRESLKPPKERRKCPTDPLAGFDSTAFSGKGSISRKELDQINAASQQQWTNEALLQCQHCQRRFLPEKLPIHQRSCTAENPSRRVTEPVARGSNTAATMRSSSYQQAEDPYSDAYASASGPVLGLNQCPTCGRRFNDISFEKHSRVCAKLQKPRKVYDSSKHRAMGTELEQYYTQNRRKLGASTTVARPNQMAAASMGQSQLRSSNNSNSGCRGGPNTGNGNALPKWKQDSLAFREAMKQAKLVSMAEQKSKATGIPLHLLLPANSSSGSSSSYQGNGGSGGSNIPSDYIQCPSCGRSFSQKAGERHIPQCKNIVNKPKHYNLLRGGKSSASSSSNNNGSFGGGGGGRSGYMSSNIRSVEDYDYDAPNPPARNRVVEKTSSESIASRKSFNINAPVNADASRGGGGGTSFSSGRKVSNRASFDGGGFNTTDDAYGESGATRQGGGRRVNTKANSTSSAFRAEIEEPFSQPIPPSKSKSSSSSISSNRPSSAGRTRSTTKSNVTNRFPPPAGRRDSGDMSGDAVLVKPPIASNRFADAANEKSFDRRGGNGGAVAGSAMASGSRPLAPTSNDCSAPDAIFPSRHNVSNVTYNRQQQQQQSAQAQPPPQQQQSAMGYSNRQLSSNTSDDIYNGNTRDNGGYYPSVVTSATNKISSSGTTPYPPQRTQQQQQHQQPIQSAVRTGSGAQSLGSYAAASSTAAAAAAAYGESPFHSLSNTGGMGSNHASRPLSSGGRRSLQQSNDSSGIASLLSGAGDSNSNSTSSRLRNR